MQGLPEDRQFEVRVAKQLVFLVINERNKDIIGEKAIITHSGVFMAFYNYSMTRGDMMCLTLQLALSLCPHMLINDKSAFYFFS
jgi:hypothetical protein